MSHQIRVEVTAEVDKRVDKMHLKVCRGSCDIGHASDVMRHFDHMIMHAIGIGEATMNPSLNCRCLRILRICWR